MLVGLQVEDENGHGAFLVTEIGWTAPPPDGARWSCCRRGDIDFARVRYVDWAGLEGDPEVWVVMHGDRRLISHLGNHGFSPIER